ncbi:AIPR family protein, partial [Priestia aryabhattai]|uniref:AIPR family protein n=1 Tax=Priestia aryabhattai TaxID=412384 RepID=UPI002E1C6BB3|nr:AIPR family protein [Priestia aryabhattai]
MINFDTSIEEFITSYLEAKGYYNMEFEEGRHLYYDKDDKNENGLFIYDVYNEEDTGHFEVLIEELKELKDIEFKEINFVIIVRSIKQKYSLPKNGDFNDELSKIKNDLKQLLEEKQLRNIKIHYKFIPLANDFLVDSFKSFDIKIRERYRATQATPLDNPKTNGMVFTANLFDIVKLYDKMGDSLFNDNLRIGLEDKQDLLEVAPEITKTLKNNPEEFWFLNNGITIIMDEKSLDLSSNNFLRLNNNIDYKKSKISVINGAQTISAASKFFFEDAKTEDTKIINEYRTDKSRLDYFAKEISNDCLNPRKEKYENEISSHLMKFFNENKEINIENTKEFIQKLLEESKIKEDKELISEKLLQKIIPNQFSINKAERQADVLLRVIYYSNQKDAIRIKSKITIALNRQKPMRMGDIALASQFVQNINYYNGLDIDNDSFSIIRRGEPEAPDFKRHSLDTVMKMLMIISEKNPGKLGSSKLSKQLEEKDKRDGLIIFRDDSIFKGVFNSKSSMEEDNETREEFKNSFKVQYS